MLITWFGQLFFVLEVKGLKHKDLTLAIDPFDKNCGLKPPRKKADILLLPSQLLHSKSWEGKPFVIEAPGEYEKDGIFVYGIQAFADNKQGKERGQVVIYKILAEGLKLCHMGAFGQKELAPEQIEAIGEIDVLMLPVGSKNSLDAKKAAGIIAQIEPRLVIPMHYKIKGLKADLDGVDKFLKEMGAERIEAQNNLKVKKGSLPEEETKIVVLEPK